MAQLHHWCFVCKSLNSSVKSVHCIFSDPSCAFDLIPGSVLPRVFEYFGCCISVLLLKSSFFNETERSNFDYNLSIHLINNTGVLQDALLSRRVFVRPILLVCPLCNLVILLMMLHSARLCPLNSHLNFPRITCQKSGAFIPKHICILINLWC